jgi:hypothetical protein
MTAMSPLLRYAVVAGLTAVVATLAVPVCSPARATTLITAHEAELPPNNAELRGGIERGPDVIPIYPAPKSGAIQSPFGFRVQFKAHGNTEINLDTLSVVYTRIPDIDLTARVKQFAGPGGIDMPNAEVPPGAHRIWIFIKDSAGHEGRAEIRFDVEKQ